MDAPNSETVRQGTTLVLTNAQGPYCPWCAGLDEPNRYGDHEVSVQVSERCVRLVALAAYSEVGA